MFFSKRHFRKVKPCFPKQISSCQGLGLGLTKKLQKWPPVLYLDCGSSYKTAYACQQRRTWQPTPYSCLENPVDRGAWWAAVHGVAQSQTRLKRLSMHACVGEGNGNPLQCSCLENPRDGAAVYGVGQSQTWLKRLSSNSTKLSSKMEQLQRGIWGLKRLSSWFLLQTLGPRRVTQPLWCFFICPLGRIITLPVAMRTFPLPDFHPFCELVQVRACLELSGYMLSTQ